MAVKIVIVDKAAIRNHKSGHIQAIFGVNRIIQIAEILKIPHQQMNAKQDQPPIIIETVIDEGQLKSGKISGGIPTAPAEGIQT